MCFLPTLIMTCAVSEIIAQIGPVETFKMTFKVTFKVKLASTLTLLNNIDNIMQMSS